MNLQGSKIKASRTKTAWKSAENSEKTAEKSVNLRVNFGKNKKASRIKALREFIMKRLTDFFGEKGWKTGKMGYNENRKRSKYCCWTVPMSDWNTRYEQYLHGSNQCLNVLNRTYEWLKLLPLYNHLSLILQVEPYLWEIETGCRANSITICTNCWTVPMRDWNSPFNTSYLAFLFCHVESYLWVSNVLYIL